MRGPSRRALLRAGGGLGLAGLASLLPGRLAAGGGNDRKFLFVFAGGGWDPTWVFAPMFDAPNVDVDADSRAATVGGLPIVDSDARPNVRRFFETWGPRACILNGFEVRSVTHERCRRLLFTGTSQPDVDDWPSTIAGRSTGFLLPHLVVSGPAYTSAYTTAVMRVGESGQLSGLLDGSALEDAEPPRAPLGSAASARVRAFLDARLDATPDPGPGRPAEWYAGLRQARAQREAVESIEDLDLGILVDGVGTRVADRVAPALTCLERGYTRCAIVQHLGQYDVGWDTHQGIAQQGVHFDLLFEDLGLILAALQTRRGVSGAPLSEEVTVVVLSEMGRSPKLNATGGKDHWTFTSALFVGPGVAGGTVVGGYDDTFLGRPVDLATGAPDDASGTLLSSAHLGATLLALAGMDPGDTAPIEAVLG